MNATQRKVSGKFISFLWFVYRQNVFLI
jgi:hypothetical protein